MTVLRRTLLIACSCLLLAGAQVAPLAWTPSGPLVARCWAGDPDWPYGPSRTGGGFRLPEGTPAPEDEPTTVSKGAAGAPAPMPVQPDQVSRPADESASLIPLSRGVRVASDWHLWLRHVLLMIRR